ncbi:MAG: exodeoxyribonuclease VII small subunit [Clostridia bacterium]|nr:exodeoxyribonuclease VII small subunit [Clostridiales bacterium]MBQ7918054.1 exodeoxyribonuclease VII small subunit [Clostridia bacterium]
MTFEESYEKLVKIKDSLENPETTLDESIKLYEESVKHTKTCLDLLSETEGKISVIKAEVDKLIEKPLDIQE